MALLPRNIEKMIPPTDEVKKMRLEECLVYLHFFNPIGPGDWYVMGGEMEGNEWIFYGAIVFTQVRIDYFSLEELKLKSLPFNMKIRRDEKFEVIPWKNLIRSLGNS